MSKSFKLFYGKGLFTKIFLLFWFTIIAAGLLMNNMSYFFHVEPQKQRIIEIGIDMLKDNSQVVIYGYEKLGKNESARLRAPGHMWLFDSNLNSIYDEIENELDLRLIQNYKQQDKEKEKKKINYLNNLFMNKKDIITRNAKLILSKKLEQHVFSIENEKLIGTYIISDSGKEYVAIKHWYDRPHKSLLDIFNKFKLFWPSYLMMSFIICFFLSKNIVKPLLYFRDITNKFAAGNLEARVEEKATKRLDEIGDIFVSFNEMADKISSMINTQKRLFSDISHELRSPLARLMVSLELLRMKNSKTETALVDRIEKEINLMNSMIEEILRFSKLESNSDKYIFEQANLDDIITEVCSDVDFEGKKKNCHLNLNIQKNIEMNCVPQLIARAVENIIRNALKHSPNDSSIEIELNSNEEKATITITDHGPGVPEKYLDKVFMPFFSCSTERTPQQNGIGLGLSIADRAIKLHHGNITLCNIKPTGFQATIILPLKS